MPEKCPETGSGFLMGGPFWAEPLHDLDFVRATLQEIQVSAAPHLPSSASCDIKCRSAVQPPELGL